MRRSLLIAAALAAGACSGRDTGRIVVRTVSDITGVPLAGIRVQVEAQPWATTGADGTATFAAVNMANLLMDGGSPLGGGSFQRGVVAALGAGFATSVLVALLGFGAELRFTCASRLPDYGALMADGLPARSIRRSLALEHNQVLLLGVPVGTILGLALLWSVAPVAGLEVAHVGLSAGGVVIGVLMTALSMSIGGLLAAGLVRSRVRFLPYEVPL